MIKVTRVEWAVSRPNVRGSLVGAFDTREEAQAVADAQELYHEVRKWTINEFRSV